MARVRKPRVKKPAVSATGRPRRVRVPRERKPKVDSLNIDYTKPYQKWWPDPIEKAPSKFEDYPWLCSVPYPVDRDMPSWPGPNSYNPKLYPLAQQDRFSDRKIIVGFVHRAHRDLYVEAHAHIGAHKELTHDATDRPVRAEANPTRTSNRRPRRNRSSG